MGQAGQLTLEGMASNYIDPAFASNKTAPIHRWVPWIAGFSRGFVSSAISQHLYKKGIVLDPFAGVGTTLIEATFHGHDAIGFEINPYAAFAAKVKLNAHLADPKELILVVKLFKHFVITHRVPVSGEPEGFKSRVPFYSPEVLRKVLVLQDFIAQIDEPVIADLFRVAFASTMVRYSNYSYEPSLGTRAGAGRDNILEYPVYETIEQKLAEICRDVEYARDTVKGKGKVILDSCFKASDYIEPQTIDLVVTSPPYLNNYHYNRNTRPHLYWLGYAKNASAFHPLEDMNFGKFWQTVRELPDVPAEFNLPNSDLMERIKLIRDTNNTKTYGGKGWANYAISYFNDCWKLSAVLKYLLKPGSTALIVVGNSVLQGIELRIDQYIGQIGEAQGLKQVDIHYPRGKRVGDSITNSGLRKHDGTKARLYESVVELQRL